MKDYILALDEGTTSVRSILFDRNSNIISMAQHEFSQIYPKPGWVEHDPIEIYANQYATMTECIVKSGISPNDIACIGITNQRETTVVWNRNNGQPVYNAVVWQCRRTSDYCEELIEKGYSDLIRNKTGLRPDAYFSATKIKWILENVDGAKVLAESGDLIFGTIDTWLIWKLTGGKVHVTDRTNASRTMLLNIDTASWDKELLDLFGIPESMMPSVKSSSEIYGTIELMGAEIPICGIAGDQQAALFGQACFSKGESKNTYGTGCFLLTNTGKERVYSKNGLITTIAASEENAPVEYALEGSVFVGGSVIQWLRDELRFISESKDSEYFATKVRDSGGVYIVPAFTGLGAPYWDMNARGTITGLTRGTGLCHITRAALESIAYQSYDLISAMEADINEKISTLKVDGGASANDFLMQFQSDIANISVIKPSSSEATAKGAAFLAGLAAGIYKGRDELKNLTGSGKEYHPGMDEETRKKLLDGWNSAVRACRTF